MSITQHTLDAARAKVRSLGMSEFGIVPGTHETHPDWQALSEASGSHANAILGLSVDWSLERVNERIARFPDVQGWFDRFLAAEEFTPPTHINELREGDIVRFLAGGSWGASREGTEHVIRTVESDASARTRDGWFIYESGYDRESWPWEFVSRPGVTVTAEPEVTTPEVPEGLEFTEYHPALLPLFTKAAQAATSAGYCSEYDSIAAAVGAPNREEIRRLAGKKFTVTIPLTVNVTFDAAGYDSDDAVNDLRRNGLTYETMREAVRTATEDSVIRNVTGYQAQYLHQWTVTEAPTP